MAPPCPMEAGKKLARRISSSEQARYLLPAQAGPHGALRGPLFRYRASPSHRSAGSPALPRRIRGGKLPAGKSEAPDSKGKKREKETSLSALRRTKVTPRANSTALPV
ncbi:hypothetical protein NDU88_002539 [Pleurodeles waltl]|uniref:Uncharacterized protein n=1 Tax=Pleurodeles waltl TaxID=8319 RepID=A0AAV7MP45_PLEWA|nr:hypothetical protein NDU88_002539 [Pleurodeles waltl]